MAAHAPFTGRVHESAEGAALDAWALHGPCEVYVREHDRHRECMLWVAAVLQVPRPLAPTTHYVPNTRVAVHHPRLCPLQERRAALLADCGAEVRADHERAVKKAILDYVLACGFGGNYEPL